MEAEGLKFWGLGTDIVYCWMEKKTSKKGRGKMDMDIRMRIEEIGRINNQAVLERIVKTDKLGSSRWAATQRITSKTMLVRIAMRDASEHVRAAATMRLYSQVVLKWIMARDKSAGVRGVAVDRITDQALLEKIAKKDSSEYVQAAATRRLKELQGTARGTGTKKSIKNGGKSD